MSKEAHDPLFGVKFELISRTTAHHSTFHTDKYALYGARGQKLENTDRTVPKREGKTMRDRRKVRGNAG